LEKTGFEQGGALDIKQEHFSKIFVLMANCKLPVSSPENWTV
jgi:hypothetical protein